ncbi:MAG: NAD(P)-dependent oxidoreductase [Thermoplasmataceae archaeon]
MTAIGFMGLGKMGIPILSRIRRSFSIHAVYDRNPSKGTLFSPAKINSEPFQMGSACDVILVSLSGDEACEDVFFGKTGLDKTIVPGTIIANLGNVSYSFSMSAYRRFAEKGAIYMDCPVMGSVQEALDGALLTMVSGDAGGFDRIRGILETFSKQVTYLGVAGNAVKMRIIATMASAASLAVSAEAIVAAEHAGIPISKSIDVLIAGNSGSSPLQDKRRTMEDGDFVPGYTLSSMIRDLRNGLDLSASINAPMPLEAAAVQYYVAASSIGLSSLDYSSVLRAFRFLSGKS